MTHLVVEKFNKPLHVPTEKWPAFLKDVVMPLTNAYAVSFDKSLIKETREGEPEISIMLVERGDYLLFQPVFSYKGFSVKKEDKETIIVPDGNRVIIVYRNKAVEESFFDKLASPSFTIYYTKAAQQSCLKGYRCA